MNMNKLILEGIKVADFCWVAAGPQLGRELAHHGATVIRVEGHKRPDVLRVGSSHKDGIPGLNRSGTFAGLNTGKLGVSIDLNNPKGAELARRLALSSDVVTEGMVPGTLKRWGLDYESLSKEKPELIYVSTSQQGQFGPYAQFGGYGSLGAALGGFSNMLGTPDRDPQVLTNNYTDMTAPWSLVMAVTGALRYRNKTGRGINIDQAQIEAGLTFLGTDLLDYQVNGHVATRKGNRDPQMAPHGVFSCAGKDRWVAIAVETDEQWRALAGVMGFPDWSRDERYATLAGRQANEDELERRISDWTTQLAAEEVMVKLQAAGVPAGVVVTGEDLFKDPQLAYREHFQWLEHRSIGKHAAHMPAYRMSVTEAKPKFTAPCMGQHNEQVFRGMLGLTEKEYADCIAVGAITTDAMWPKGMRID